MEKTCFKCGESKPFKDFYRHNAMSGGRLNKCKECTKQDTRRNRLLNLDHYREYDRKRGNRLPTDYHLKYRERYPLKYKARIMVNNAVRDGRLEKKDSCEECGSNFSIHGHHDDYAKPLEVRWLCAGCHHQWHAKYGEAKNAVSEECATVYVDKRPRAVLRAR